MIFCQSRSFFCALDCLKYRFGIEFIPDPNVHFVFLNFYMVLLITNICANVHTDALFVLFIPNISSEDKTSVQFF